MDPLPAAHRNLLTYHPGRPPKCSDIDTEVLLRGIEAMCRIKGGWLATSEVHGVLLPGLPFKLVHAKLAKLVAQGRLSGCPCGCRGDWEPITDWRTPGDHLKNWYIWHAYLAERNYWDKQVVEWRE